MSEYYIGIMCGTSLDSLDISLVRFKNRNLLVKSFHTYLFTTSLKRKIIKSKDLKKVSISTQNDISKFISECIVKTIRKNKLSQSDIHGIGYPGITLNHDPKRKTSTYMGDPNIIKSSLNIPLVADFRQCDIKSGGEGAPLTGYFHGFLNKKLSKKISFLNLGGFANISIHKAGKVISYDTGPANYLIDNWCKRKFQKDFDKNGNLAKKGAIDYQLLKRMTSDSFFKKNHPKSTGFEKFNIKWLERQVRLTGYKISNRDILTTLTYFTITTVAQELNKDSLREKKIYIYGGGVNNQMIIDGILSSIKHRRVNKMNFGITEKNLEATAFAWLTYKRIKGQKIFSSTITGKRSPNLLGNIY